MEGLIKINNLYITVIYKFISNKTIRCIDLKGNIFYTSYKSLV